MPQKVVVIGLCFLVFIGLKLFTTKSKTGLAMSAVSMNKLAASLMGISFKRITSLTYAISAAIAASIGVFSAPFYYVGANVGSTLGLKALVAAVMGGFGNATGALVGGILLGLIETLCSLYISSAYKDAFSYIALIIILFARPQGILGRKRIVKV